MGEVFEDSNKKLQTNSTESQTLFILDTVAGTKLHVVEDKLMVQ